MNEVTDLWIVMVFALLKAGSFSYLHSFHEEEHFVVFKVGADCLHRRERSTASLLTGEG